MPLPEQPGRARIDQHGIGLHQTSLVRPIMPLVPAVNGVCMETISDRFKIVQRTAFDAERSQFRRIDIGVVYEKGRFKALQLAHDIARGISPKPMRPMVLRRSDQVGSRSLRRGQPATRMRSG